MNSTVRDFLLLQLIFLVLVTGSYAQEKKNNSGKTSDLKALQEKITKAFKEGDESAAKRLEKVSDLIRKELVQIQKEKDPVDLDEVATILRQTCYRCHKGEGSESGYAFNILNVESMVDEGMISEEDHQGSEIWSAMSSNRMPPRNRSQLPRPSYEQIETIKNWIDQGAKSLPKPKPREKVTLKSELELIRADLRKQDREDRFNIRYFTLSNLHNDPTVDLQQLKLTRIGLAKTLNSLSWEALLVEPEVVDEKHQTIFAVDISQLGWTREHWNAMVKAYPYSLSYGSLDDPEIADIDADIADLRGGDTTPVALRADWLISVATKPPLYYTLMFDLELPEPN